MLVPVRVRTLAPHAAWRSYRAFGRRWQERPAVARGSNLIRESFKAVPFDKELMRRMSPVLRRRTTPVVLKGSPVLGRRVSPGVSVLDVWTEGLAALLGRASSVWIRIRQRAPERRAWSGRRRLIIFVHVQRIGVLVLVQALLERIPAVFVVRINGASRRLWHGGLGHMVAIRSGGRCPGCGEVGLWWESVVEMTERGACKGWRRTSGTMEIERRRRSGEPRWSQVVWSVEGRGRWKTLRGPLRSNVLGGYRVVKHLRRRSSLAHGLEGQRRTSG